MSSCKRATGARKRPEAKDSAATKTDGMNLCRGILCSCGKMCKDSRGLKIHQTKSKCQLPENKLKPPPKKCFVSLEKIILSSCLTFDDQIYFKTSERTFIPVRGNHEPVSSNKCYVETSDIIINPNEDPLNADINSCKTPSCHTCSIFINDQEFKSNLTGKKYKTVTYDRLSCGSTNVIYGIHCRHCGLVYVGETGRTLRSRMNGHRSAVKKGGQTFCTGISINLTILWMT